MKRTEVDIVDVHLTSISERVDAFTQYPLLDGTKKYTVELTEFVCPLAGQDALPSETNDVDNLLFEIRRKYVSPVATPVAHAHSSLVTPPLLTAEELATGIYLPYGLFTLQKVQFRKDDQRPMATPGDLAYHMQRFFDDIIGRYMQAPAVALALLNEQLVIVATENDVQDAQQQIVDAQQAIMDDANSTEEQKEEAEDERDLAQYYIIASQQIEAAAELLVDGPNGDDGLQAISDGMGARIVGSLHGGAPNVDVTADTNFVTVMLQPNGCIKLFFSPIFTKHFFLATTTYGTRVLGLGKDGVVAFSRNAYGNVVQGYTALTGNNPAVTIVAGSTVETVEYPGLHPLERYFDHRIRLEIEAQIGIPPTVVWSTDDRQKISHVISTFPIQMTSQSSVLCNSEGAATDVVHYQSDMLVGDITWRRAEDKISERYLVNNSQYFHNVRLELFIVRKEWFQDEFRFIRQKMSFTEGESWTAKLRFRSIK